MQPVPVTPPKVIDLLFMVGNWAELGKEQASRVLPFRASCGWTRPLGRPFALVAADLEPPADVTPPVRVGAAV